MTDDIIVEPWSTLRPRALAASFHVVIPSFDRPRELVRQTLPFLLSHGISCDKICVFLQPGRRDHAPETRPEWERYSDELRKAAMPVQLREGGKGLTEQMLAAFDWAGEGAYIVVCSDTVRTMQRLGTDRSRKKKMVPLRAGELQLVLQHGAKLMRDYGFQAWSPCAVHKAQWMSKHRLTRRLGLLDGNFLGLKIPPDYATLRNLPDQVFFVGLSCWLWKHGYSFVRYSMLACLHPYRLPGGQATRFPTESARRRRENEAIQNLAHDFPGLISFQKKTTHSLKRMQYKFASLGPDPLRMNTSTSVKMSAAAKTFLLRKTGTERMRKLRSKQRQRDGKAERPEDVDMPTAAAKVRREGKRHRARKQ